MSKFQLVFHPHSIYMYDVESMYPAIVLHPEHRDKKRSFLVVVFYL